jgi:ribosomal protein S18 acetylase RimI-like enzyme
MLIHRQAFGPRTHWSAADYRRARILLCWRGAQLLGFLAHRRITERGWPAGQKLQAIAVLAEARGCGVADMLMRSFMARYSRAFLEVESGNARAIRVYERLGWKLAGKQPRRGKPPSLIYRFVSPA